MARNALVTGGVSGIGAATARLLKASGCNVVANFFGNDAEADAFRDETGITVRAWDVSDFDASQKAVAAVEKEFGPVDILVNNAGITRDSTLHKMTPEQWRSVIAVDLDGCFNMCRAVIGGMRDRRFGRIVNVSSINALSGQFGQTNYAAAKAGVIGFTKALALESAARGITVNAIAPVIPIRAWYTPFRPRSWKALSRRSPSADWRRRRKSPAECCSWSRTMPGSSQAPRCRSTVANTWPEVLTESIIQASAGHPSLRRLSGKNASMPLRTDTLRCV